MGGGRTNGDAGLVTVPPDPLRPLVDAAVEGDDVALDELVRRTQGAVWRTCTALGSPGETEDLVQETYLRALRGLRRFRGDTTVLRWLVAVARNVCADHVRARTRRRRLDERLRAVTVADPAPDRRWVEVDDLLDALDADQRDAFLLTQVLGFGYAEAADALGCPVGTIRSRVARARARLVEQATVEDGREPGAAGRRWRAERSSTA